MTRTGFIGLGSNVGKRREHLQRAVALLSATAGVEVTSQSLVYETKPVAVAHDQGDFLNQVIGIESALSPAMLRQVSEAIETELGRAVEHGSGLPRTIDLDIISLGDLAGEFENVILPHPRYSERRFVLQPLADIAPEFRDPTTDQSVNNMLENCNMESIRVYSGEEAGI